MLTESILVLLPVESIKDVKLESEKFWNVKNKK